MSSDMSAEHGVPVSADRDAQHAIAKDDVPQAQLEDLLRTDAERDHQERDPIDRVANDDPFAAGCARPPARLRCAATVDGAVEQLREVFERP